MEQRVGTVYDAYEAWNTVGPEGLRPWVTDDLELHDPPQMPDARAWQGRDAVIARLEEVPPRSAAAGSTCARCARPATRSSSR